MNLIDVYTAPEAPAALYDLLKRRSGEHSISHQQMPGFDEHAAFVSSKPYRYWYLVSLDHAVIGSAYLTDNNEIGLYLIDAFQHLTADALRRVVSSHEPLPAIKSKRVAAFSINANPRNTGLITAIESVGGDHVQNTYVLPKAVNLPA